MSPWTGERAKLARRVSRFIDLSLSAEPREPFEALAVDIAREQQRLDPVVRSLADGPIDRFDQIPAVPVGVFQELDVGFCPPEEAAATFHTSGTTTGNPGVHRLRSTALYDQGSLAFARRCLPGMPRRVVALLGDPLTHPHSSLSHMVSLFGIASWHVRGGALDVESLSRAIDAARSDGAPVLVATTAFSAADWLETSPQPLPKGSVLFVTGGFKGRRTELDSQTLYGEIRGRLRPARLATEYGMTELSSQLWGTPELPYLPPPWLSARAVEPITGAPLPQGEIGLLRFFDLCNLDGSLGIETMDLGAVARDGTITLHGRLTGSPPRGCSLSVEP